MMSCCAKLSCFKPRYKRLVDNIFPANPEEGLVKSNMEKLTFYSLSSPEKLDRIGEYLYQRATHDINRRRYKLVEIAMEAMDLLLMACHAQTLNLFVESFLKMIQKLLEDSNPNLQIMATNSFVKFANIEEDAPSYHRRYDFFISKFSSMCHGSNDNVEVRNNIRMAGIKGLQGVIRKTVSDDLVENIWEKQHMEKIVPSLLYNMQSGNTNKEEVNEEDSEPKTPPVLAESVLREIVSRASFSHINDVLKPLLTHLDHHQLWIPHEFAIHTFQIVMLSIQPQYSYRVVESLMTHLDQTSSAKTKTYIAVVLSAIISIAAGESVGPSALDIINNLLTLLRDSVSSKNPTIGQYQENLINALGQFANHHPDYQKIEIMLFIMNKVPTFSKKDQVDQLLQIILLKSLLKVSVQYRTVSFDKAFPASFLQPLLKMAKASESRVRIIVMEILQALLDRHKNQQTLSVVTIKTYHSLSLEPPSRSDIIFANKQVGNLMNALIKSMILDDQVIALESAYTTAALMICEMSCIETLQEFMVFIFHLQDTALGSDDLTVRHRCNLHRIVISLVTLLSRCVGIYVDYCERIIDRRRQEAPFLLPPLTDDNSPTLHSFNLDIPSEVLLDRTTVVECLQAAGIRSERLQMESLFPSDRRTSLIDGVSTRDGNLSDTYPDIESIKSSPDVSRKALLNIQELSMLELNFEGMKRILTATNETSKQDEINREKKESMAKSLKEQDFDELMNFNDSSHDHIQNKLNELFNSLSMDRPYSNDTSKNQKPIYEKNFPELFFF
ncbi:hypothetical protein PVAND_003692 [Polypedilum vanderplanki]|uniref:Protein EFR3 homolog cmp44E n=1 Tax=Polypedilum vanderplanki TaxID=319348 RepID=A0A9J6BUU0_POLVA|nr:hypothetical protein PVAND_003692 [Polypedilum vanderplanki]